MKKVFYLFFALMAIVVTSCSDDESTSVQFERSEYALTNGTIPVKITVSNPPATATELPVSFGGTAVQGQDYTVSATKYVIGGNAQVLSIEVSAKNNFSEAKTITMSVSGVASASTTIKLGARDKMLYSFSQKAYVLGGETEVRFDLLHSKTGEPLKVEQDLTVAIAPDSESTAVEGTHYEFVNKTAVIQKGQSSCVFKLKAIKTEEGKNTIVIAPQVTETEGFIAGSFPVATVNMIGSYASDLMGTWVMETLSTDKTFMNDLWMLGEAELKGLPEFNAGDTFTFSGSGTEGLTLTTDLKSEFKNYFQPTSAFTIDKELVLRDNAAQKLTLQMLRLTNVNRYFSPTEQSEDKEAFLAVRNVTNDKGEALLDVYVIDYYSKTFFPSFIDYEMYNSTKPMATMSGVFLNFTLKKK